MGRKKHSSPVLPPRSGAGVAEESSRAAKNRRGRNTRAQTLAHQSGTYAFVCQPGDLSDLFTASDARGFASAGGSRGSPGANLLQSARGSGDSHSAARALRGGGAGGRSGHVSLHGGVAGHGGGGPHVRGALAGPARRGGLRLLLDHPLPAHRTAGDYAAPRGSGGGHHGRNALVRRQAGVHVLYARLRRTHGRRSGGVESVGAIPQEPRGSILRGGKVAMGGRSAADRGGAAAITTAHAGNGGARGGGRAHGFGARADTGVARRGRIRPRECERVPFCAGPRNASV